MSNKQIIPNLLCLVLMFFLLPLRWLGAVFIASVLHELGHYFAVYLVGGDIQSFRFSISGAVMQASDLTERSELICLLAGPLAGLLPVFLIRTIPTIALCGIIQSAYNLLPIYPLDGGRILRNIILILGGTTRTFEIIEYSVLTLLFFSCIYVYFRFGISLFLMIVSLIFLKTPCKPHEDWI